MNKKEALSIAFKCAELYKKELLNKNLLFIAVDKKQKVSAFESSFFAGNYKHLTGLILTSEMSPNDFFWNCIKRRISVNDIQFKADGTTPLKLKILPILLCKNLSANMIGSFSDTHLNLYTEKLVGKQSGSMGFVFDRNKNRYVPNTVLNGDMREMITLPVKRIISTHRKNMLDKDYTETVYLAKNVDFEKINYPIEYSYLKTCILGKNSLI